MYKSKFTFDIPYLHDVLPRLDLDIKQLPRYDDGWTRARIGKFPPTFPVDNVQNGREHTSAGSHVTYMCLNM